jgi:hypothetical protein
MWGMVGPFDAVMMRAGIVCPLRFRRRDCECVNL